MADLFEIGQKIGTRDTIDNAFSRQAEGRRKNAEAFQKWAKDQADQGLPIDINNAMAYRDSISRLDPTLRGGQLSDAVVESIIGRQNERSAQKILADAAKATTDINTGYDNLSKLVDTSGDYNSFLDKIAVSQTGKVDDASRIQAQASTHQFRLDENQFYELQNKKRQQAIADAAQTGMFTDSQDVDDINFHFKDRPAWLREGLVRMMEDKEQKARISKVEKIKKFFENFQNDQWATYDKPTFLMETKARFETEGLEFTEEDSRMFEGMYTARSRVAQNINQNKALEAARKDPIHTKMFDLDSTPTEEQAFESFNSAITRAGGIPYASIEDWRAGEGGSYWLRARTQQTREFEERKQKEEKILLENIDATFGKDGDYTEGKTYNNFKKALASAGIVGEGDGAQPEMIALAAELSQRYFVNTATAEEMVRYAQKNWDPAKQTMSDFAQILIGKYKPLTIAQFKAQARESIANKTGTRVTPRSRLVDHYANTTAKLNGWSADLKRKLERLPSSARDENGSWISPDALNLIEGARNKILEEIELYTEDVTSDSFYLFTDNRSAEAQKILLNGKAELQAKLLAIDTIVASAQPRGEEKTTPLTNTADGKDLSGNPKTDTATPGTTGNTSTAPVSTTTPVPKGQEIPVQNPEGTGRDKTLQIISGGEKDLASYEVDNEGWIRVRPTEDTVVKRGRGPQATRSTLRPRELTWDTLGEDLQSMLVDEALRVMRQNVMNPLINQSYGQTPWRAMRFAIEDSNIGFDNYKGEAETKILQTAWAIAQDAFLKNMGE